MPRNTQSAASPRAIQLSIVVPLFNEAATISELHRRLNAALGMSNFDTGADGIEAATRS